MSVLHVQGTLWDYSVNKIESPHLHGSNSSLSNIDNK